MPGPTNLASLTDLYVHELKDVYSAEKQLSSVLPKMAKRASSDRLQNTFQKHIRQTREHVNRVEKILKRLDEKPAQISPSKGMKGIIKESSSFLKSKGKPEVLDAALITAAHRVEHYEIAAYGTLCNFASLLGQREDYDLLCQALIEAKSTDKKLTAITEGGASEDADKPENITREFLTEAEAKLLNERLGQA
jgi:ferritin-like metal-binding protein YciE